MSRVSRWSGPLAALCLWGAACSTYEQVEAQGEPEPVGEAAQELRGVRRPVGRWNLDECIGGSHVSPWGLNGVTCAKGVSGAAASFDGVDDLVQIPNAPELNFTTALSVSAWVKPTQTTSRQNIVSKWYTPDSFGLRIEDGHFKFAVALAGSPSPAYYTIQAPLSAGVWTHVVANYNGWRLRLYVNGTLATSLVVQDWSLPARALQQSSRPITIGNHPSWDAYAGLIDEVALYNANLRPSEIAALAGQGEPAAIILVDHRLYPLLSSKLEEYRDLAEARRGFRIGLHVVKDIDDWAYSQTRRYLRQQDATYAPGLKGALLVGNIKLPSFYKNRNDLPNTHLLSRYFEDLDGVFTKTYADGAIDPQCPTSAPYCVVYGPVTVPVHDFDYTEKGATATPELFVSLMPVGTATDNTYQAWANQLSPYLDKVLRFYKGQLSTNRKYYFVSPDKGETFNLTWAAWPLTSIDFHGKAGPNGETGTACLTPSGNVCYQRWPLEQYASYADFESAYLASPFVGLGWQEPGILTSHMNASTYEVVELNSAGNETGLILSTAEARQVTGAALLMAMGGSHSLAFKQPGGANVDTAVTAGDNVALAYLYGSSQAIAALGTAFARGHDGYFPTVYSELKVNGRYLGRAHSLRMNQLYSLSGTSPWELREYGMEMLVGDPFMDLRPCGNGVCDSGEDGMSCAQDCGCTARAACDGNAVGCSCSSTCVTQGNCCADAYACGY